jgi:hypothetical protein
MSQSKRCQFGTCEREGKERAVSYHSALNIPAILTTVCDGHFEAAMVVNSPEWIWLKSFLEDSN